MNGWIDLILLVLAGLLLVPVLVFCLECTLALPPRRARAIPPAGVPRPRVAVLIPAHNEQLVIAETLCAVTRQLRRGDRIVVVADNCTDDTAAIAASHGCEVVRRSDRVRRGKGFALDAGLRHIESSGERPEVLVIFDADCVPQDGTVSAIAHRAAATGRPVQSTYVMSVPPNAPPNAAVSALAVLVKNFVRPRGLSRVGLPCMLTGTGMAFPWDVIRAAKLASGNIVEDMQLGIDLALAGHAPVFCEEARVTGRLPSALAASVSQRRRWEHGHLRTLACEAPRLLVRGVLSGRWTALALLAELCVPPLALLVMLVTLATLAAAALVPLAGASPVPALMLCGGLGYLTLCVVAAWLRFGRRAMPVASVLGAPSYVLAKVPLYATFVRGRQTEWVRTDRTPAAPATPLMAKKRVSSV